MFPFFVEPLTVVLVSAIASPQGQMPKKVTPKGYPNSEDVQSLDAAQDDSPFIRPRSPSPLRSRPSLQPFRGTGSVGFPPLSRVFIDKSRGLDACRNSNSHSSSTSSSMGKRSR